MICWRLIVIPDFIVLQVGLLWFEFKINSESMFFSYGERSFTYASAEEIVWVCFSSWWGIDVLKRSLQRWVLKEFSSMEERYWNFKAMKCFQEMHSMRLTVFRKMQCFTVLKMTDVMCHFWPSAFFWQSKDSMISAWHDTTL